MLSGTTHAAWDSSHATSLSQASAKHGEHVGPIAEHARTDAYIVWQRIECVVTDARELRIAYLLFHCGLTPREIVQRCAPEFPDIQEVLSLRCTIMKKLIHVV